MQLLVAQSSSIERLFVQAKPGTIEQKLYQRFWVESNGNNTRIKTDRTTLQEMANGTYKTRCHSKYLKLKINFFYSKAIEQTQFCLEYSNHSNLILRIHVPSTVFPETTGKEQEQIGFHCSKIAFSHPKIDNMKH